MTEITYGKMDEILRSLGFMVRIGEMEARGRIYEHRDKKALIAKLKARYPDGFTPHDALNRDLAKEQEALEGR